MRFSRILTRIFKKTTCISLVAATLMLSGCSTMQPVTDAVLWLPRKIIALPGKLWRATGFRSIDEANKWQDKLEFGPRRRPVNNPGNHFGGDIDGQTNNTSQQQYMGGAAMGMGAGQHQMPSTMGQMPSYPMGNSMGGGAGGAPQDLMGGGYGGGYPSAQDNFQPYPTGGAGGSPADMYGSSPYGNNQGQSPFAPSQHKIIRMFEPMAMEVAQASPMEDEARDLQVYIKEVSQEPAKENSKNMFPLNDYAPERKAAKNQVMFPLEEYAPKSTATINQIDEAGGVTINQLPPSSDNMGQADDVMRRMEAAGAISPASGSGAAVSAPVPAAVIAPERAADEKTLEETLGVFDADKIAIKAATKKETKEKGEEEPAALPKNQLRTQAVEEVKKEEKKKEGGFFSKKKPEEPRRRIPLNNNLPITNTAKQPLVLDNDNAVNSIEETGFYIKGGDSNIVPPPVVVPKTEDKSPELKSDDGIVRGVLPNSRYSGNR